MMPPDERMQSTTHYRRDPSIRGAIEGDCYAIKQAWKMQWRSLLRRDRDLVH